MSFERKVISESQSTGKRLLIEDRGYFFEGKRRKSLIIEKKCGSATDCIPSDGWEPLAEFSLTKARAEQIAIAITSNWESEVDTNVAPE